MSVINKLIGKGPKFPFTPNTKKVVSISDSIERINQSLFIIFSTNKGSRLLMPEFGSELFKYRFDPYDDVLLVRIRETILSDIKAWEPRIIVDDINFYDSDSAKDNNILYISISYTIINTEVKGNYVYPYQRDVYDIFKDSN